MQVQSLSWEDPLENEIATHSSILAWKSHGQRSLVGYSPWGHKESEMTKKLPCSFFTCVGPRSKIPLLFPDASAPPGLLSLTA